RVYDTGSGQLVFNSYETLIAWDHESYYTFRPVLATNIPTRTETTLSISNTTADVNDDMYDVTWSDGSISKGYTDLNAVAVGFSVGDVLYLNTAGTYRAWWVESMVGTYTVNLRRYSYTFNLRTSPVINFIDEMGAIVDTFDIDDAEFSFERGLVQDTGPQWMYYTSMFGCFNSAAWAGSNASLPMDTTIMNALDQAHLIDDAVETSGNDLTLNLGMPFPDNAFKQTVSNTWGSIVSKEFTIALGASKGYGWNGDLYTLNSLGYPAWHNASSVWHRSRSPLDETGDMRWVGTGPYYVGVFNQPELKVDLLRNDGYWGGWPAAGRNDSIAVYEIQYIEEWSTRKTAFLSGAIDTCAVPRANMFELLQTPNTQSEPILIGGKPVIKTIKNIVPTIAMDCLHPTFVVTDTSSYIGTGHFPDGVPVTFFNNTAVRKAFAYSFNSSQYAIESYYGEADYRKNPLAAGLYPDYYDDSVPGYTANYSAAEAQLKAADFNGTSVWDSGFRLTLVFNTGNDMRRIACEMIRDFFTVLSTYDGRTNPNPFQIDIANIDWNVYVDQFYNLELPIWSIGWLADFADADNFMRPYMHSYGDFSGSQLYSVDNGWGDEKDSLLDQALMEPDGPSRKALYNDLAMIYYNDCPSIPITCPRGRRWTNYWVKGWYYDALYPAFYIRDYFKMDNCWFDMTGQTPFVSDGICNMRDIQYLILAFNAKAPQPGVPADPKWNGNYGANGGVDPSGDRLSNMRDIQGAILHFNHKNNTATP
ncbi:MAG TPA: ABC transporter substrate-binding protein, partial [Patescibacteria group bacterium]|nr:ABC transporter substrate-binding protein [Patescibacteria group bacterium]